MAGKERAVAYRMADEEGMCLFMEGVVAVSRHLLGAMFERAGTASCCIRMEWCFSLMSGVSPY